MPRERANAPPLPLWRQREKMPGLFQQPAELTRDPRGIRRADVEALRAAGLSDAEIFEMAFVMAYFNYTNRVAEGLGVELE